MELQKKSNEIPLKIKTRTIEILKSCNKNQLLWIYERYFNKIYSVVESPYSPSMYLNRENLQKQTPPNSFTDIIVMQVEMDSEREKKIYNEYVLTQSLAFLNSKLQV
jgi:hypothetical protein